MNKEELEQEATEYAQKLGVKDFIAKPKEIVAYFGYLAGAEPREKRIADLEEQIEKMKCCENCAWWYKLPNGQRDCAETCENLDNWSLRR